MPAPELQGQDQAPVNLSMAVSAGDRLLCYNGDNYFVHGHGGAGNSTGLWVADLAECPAIWRNVRLPCLRATSIQPSIATLFGGNVAIIFGGHILSRVSLRVCVRACVRAQAPFDMLALGTTYGNTFICS